MNTEELFEEVMTALQPAEELGGPDDVAYVVLMERLAHECAARARRVRERMQQRYVAIGNDGQRAVVWGVGLTYDESLEDASAWMPHPQYVRSLYVLAVSEELADRVEAGTVACSDLGIAVRYDAHGAIVGAEVAS